MRQVTFLLGPIFKTNNICGIKRSGAGGANTKTSLSQFFIEKAEGPGITPGSVAPCTAALSPTRASPSAAATGLAAPLFTDANLSASFPLAYSASSAGPGLAFSHLSAAFPVRVFAPPSGTGLGFTHAEESSENHFRAEIMPGNALTHTFIPGAPPDDLETHRI